MYVGGRHRIYVSKEGPLMIAEKKTHLARTQEKQSKLQKYDTLSV